MSLSHSCDDYSSSTMFFYIHVIQIPGNKSFMAVKIILKVTTVNRRTGVNFIVKSINKNCMAMLEVYLYYHTMQKIDG